MRLRAILRMGILKICGGSVIYTNTDTYTHKHTHTHTNTHRDATISNF